MKNYTHIQSKKYESDKNKFEVNLCDNVMECPECSSFLNKRNFNVIDGIIFDYEDDIPLDITRIEIDINPNERNIKNYSFDGIENILKNLFHIESTEIKNELLKTDIYFKVYFFKNEFYTIPSIRLEVFIFNKISDDCFGYLSNTLNNKVFSLTNSLGIIERKLISHSLKLTQYLQFKMLLGAPEFKNEGIYKRKGFSDRQLKEMNFIFSTTILKLDVKNTIEDREPRLFDEIRILIFQSKYEKEEIQRIEDVLKTLVLEGGVNIDIEKGYLENIRYAINNDKDYDDLPF